MGLFDHLFKPKPDAAGEKSGAASPKPPDAPEKLAESGAATADPSAFLQPKGYGAGSDDPLVPVPPWAASPAEKKPPVQPPPGEPSGEVVLTLGDILPRIPTHFLRTGMHDLRRELRFKINALSSDIARGRASVPLSTIASLCPEIFHSPIGRLEDVDVRLPLQKLVEQIGCIRADAQPRWHAPETARPPETPLAAPAAEIAAPPVAPPAPPATAEMPLPRPAPVFEPTLAPALTSALDSAPVPEPTPAAEELQIHLSVAALLPGIPRELILGSLPHVDERLRIALPFAPVERQLSSGRVEVSSRRFVSALPPELRPYFEPREGVKVPLPLEEIFQNLPSSAANPAPVPPLPALEEAPIPTPVIPRAASVPENSLPLAPEPLAHESGALLPEVPPIPDVAPIAEVSPAISIAPPGLSPPLAAAVSEPVAAPAPEPVAPPILEPVALPAPEPVAAAASVPAPSAASPSATTESSPSPRAADAPPTGFVSAVRLPPVRLFAPPPPIFAAAATSPPDAPVAAPLAPPASVPVVGPEVPPVQSQVPEATEPAQASPPLAPAPAAQPQAIAEPGIAAAVTPVIPAPIHLKPAVAAEAPRPTPGATNPEPAPVALRPPFLQPPMLFGQIPPAAVPTAAAPVVPLPVQPPPPVPLAPAAPAAPTEAPAEVAPVFSLPIPKPVPPPEPAPIRETALPALPLKRFDQDSLQALFMTEEVLDLQKISRLAASLPGVQACVIATRETAVTGGVLPEGFDVTALLGLAPRVGEAASRLPIGGLKHFTIYGEYYSVSFFERSGLSLCAVHRPRSFVPGVREKLVALADELAG